MNYLELHKRYGSNFKCRIVAKGYSNETIKQAMSEYVSIKNEGIRLDGRLLAEGELKSISRYQ